MSPRAGVGGLRDFTATCFVPSATYAFRGHSRKTCEQEVRHRGTKRTAVAHDVLPESNPDKRIKVEKKKTPSLMQLPDGNVSGRDWMPLWSLAAVICHTSIAISSIGIPTCWATGVQISTPSASVSILITRPYRATCRQHVRVRQRSFAFRSCQVPFAAE